MFSLHVSEWFILVGQKEESHSNLKWRDADTSNLLYLAQISSFIHLAFSWPAHIYYWNYYNYSVKKNKTIFNQIKFGYTVEQQGARKYKIYDTPFSCTIALNDGQKKQAGLFFTPNWNIAYFY